MRDHAIDTRDEVVALAGTLWERPVHEHRTAVVEALRYRVHLLGGGDLGLVEAMLRESRTWAPVDPLASEVAGPIAAADESAGRVFDRWARDDDFWLRRSALLRPLRTGGGDWERFGRYGREVPPRSVGYCATPPSAVPSWWSPGCGTAPGRYRCSLHAKP